MRLLISSACAIVLTGCASFDQPYRGQEQRSIKALSASEARQYLAGAGMGTARPAELNSYPGPMHVLQHADALALSATQRAATQAIFDRMHARAKGLGKQIVDHEEQLDRVYATGTATDGAVARLVREIGRLQGEFRLAHLDAHLEMRALLAPAQIAQYDALRGYVR